jgi:hypothetical protein
MLARLNSGKPENLHLPWRDRLAGHKKNPPSGIRTAVDQLPGKTDPISCLRFIVVSLHHDSSLEKVYNDKPNGPTSGHCRRVQLPAAISQRGDRPAFTRRLDYSKSGDHR